MDTAFSASCSHSARIASRRAVIARETISAIIRKPTAPMVRLTKEKEELVLAGATL